MGLYDIVYKYTATVLCTLLCVHTHVRVCVCVRVCACNEGLLVNSAQDGDVNRMQAMNKVAEWLLQDPQICSYIACENGIIREQDPEAHNWSTNTGPVPAGYRLIHQWRARKLPISRLRDALIKHHHNAAARCLQPFCDGMPYTEV